MVKGNQDNILAHNFTVVQPAIMNVDAEPYKKNDLYSP